jgi:hypothetical protein
MTGAGTNACACKAGFSGNGRTCTPNSTPDASAPPPDASTRTGDGSAA